MNTRAFLNGALDIAGTFLPGVAAAARLVNAFVDDGKQLDPDKATGQQVLDAYESLHPSLQESIDENLQVELARINASVDKLQAMVSAEIPSGNTRPEIALMMAYTVAFAVLAMMVIWFVAVWGGDKDVLEQLKDSWPLMLTLLGTPTALLRAYFGLRTKEKHARYAAASGQSIAEAVGGIARIFKK